LPVFKTVSNNLIDLRLFYNTNDAGKDVSPEC
jgi:hypothetical protein